MTELPRGRQRSFARTRSGRWHRFVGALFGLFFAFLALTGVCIHHASDLGFDETWVRAPWVLRLWGVEASFEGVATDNGWVASDGRSVYLPDGEPLPGRELRSAVAWPDGWALAADDQLYLLTPEGELVDRWDRSSLPGPIARLGTGGGRLVLEVGGEIFVSDDALLSFEPGAGHLSIAWGEERTALPGELAATLRERGAGPGLSLERILLDLHSARVLGAAGPWLLDLVTLALTLVVATGLLGWWRGRVFRPRRPAARAKEQRVSATRESFNPSAETRNSDRRSA